MINDFKKFIMRGNVTDLAIAVIVGAAFTAVVSALVKDMITPLITAVFGKGTNFANLSFTINGSVFNYGNFLNAVVSFVLIAVVVFFFIVQPINKMVSYSKRNKIPAEPTDKKCPECLSVIPKAATRCAFCTTKLKN